jgi:uncharacterized membrane protein YjgN (DUF898 family)
MVSWRRRMVTGAIILFPCERRVNLLVYSLSLHRHSYIGFILVFAIGKLTPFLQIQEFRFHNMIVTSSTSAARFSFHMSTLEIRVGLTLVKETVLRINLNIDGTPITSRTHTHTSHSETSRLLTSSLSLGVPASNSPINPV